MLEYQNTKLFLPGNILQISLEKFFWIKRAKNTVPWTYVVSDINGKKMFGTFYGKELQKKSRRRI